MDYCWRTSAGRERDFRQRLFLSLLQIYLDSTPAVGAAVDLLNNHAAAFDAMVVLQVLPGSWSAQLVMRFLREALRDAFHQRRMKEVERALARAEQHRLIYTRVSSTKTNMLTKDSKGTNYNRTGTETRKKKRLLLEYRCSGCSNENL